jgi:hypothetical protein
VEVLQLDTLVVTECQGMDDQTRYGLLAGVNAIDRPEIGQNFRPAK